MASFRSLWIGAALSPVERMCIQSFLAQGHAFELLVYHPVANVPPGCGLAEAGDILPEDQVFQYQEGVSKGGYSGFANRFRYKLLLDRGGWWVDTDVVCLTSEIAEPSIALAREDAMRVNNAILCFPAGHPAMRFAFDSATAAGQTVGFAQSGPVLMSDVVERFALQPWLVPTQSFYPIRWQEFGATLRPSQRDNVTNRTRGASFLHLWNEMFRRAGYDKDCRPPAGSYLCGLFERYCMGDSFRREYKATEVGDRLQLEVQALRPA